MFDDDTLNARADEPAPEILSLFREWRAAMCAVDVPQRTYGEEEMSKRLKMIEALEEHIFEAPAVDARGLAVKAFILIREFYAEELEQADGEPRLRGFEDDKEGFLGARASRALVESLVEFLPEIRDLCAPMLAAPVPASISELAQKRVDLWKKCGEAYRAEDEDAFDRLVQKTSAKTRAIEEQIAQLTATTRDELLALVNLLADEHSPDIRSGCGVRLIAALRRSARALDASAEARP